MTDKPFSEREGADGITADQCIRLECLRFVLETDEPGAWCAERIHMTAIAAATFYSFVTGCQLDQVMVPRNMKPPPLAPGSSLN
jgi:hypothetical protein